MKVEKLLPEVYYRESRDFGLIGRSLEVILNYMKLQSDLSATSFFNENVNKDLITLLAKTVGFETRHEYINKDLLLIVKNFNDLVRRKGMRSAIRDAIKLLAVSQNKTIQDENVLVQEAFEGEGEKKRRLYKYILTVPFGLLDLILLEDLLEYILPAGWLYEIHYVNIVKQDSGATTTAEYLEDGKTTKPYAFDGYQLNAIYGQWKDNPTKTSVIDDADPENNNNQYRATWYTGHIYDGEVTTQDEEE